MTNTIEITYALYGRISYEQPLIRIETLKEAKEEFLTSLDYTMLVCEVLELRNGKPVIIQEGVIKSPQIWLPADRFIPEFDDNYLCYLVRKEECGSFREWQEVIEFKKMDWQISTGSRVTHWMNVEDPTTKLKLQ